MIIRPGSVNWVGWVLPTLPVRVPHFKSCLPWLRLARLQAEGRVTVPGVQARSLFAVGCVEGATQPRDAGRLENGRRGL